MKKLKAENKRTKNKETMVVVKGGNGKKVVTSETHKNKSHSKKVAEKLVGKGNVTDKTKKKKRA